MIDTHGPGADKVAGWVLSWGKQGAAVGHDADVDHDSAEQGGFDDVTISRLSTADGARFDRLYLTALAEHLDNGAEIWRSESDEGTHEGATDLAASLRDVEAKLRRAAQRLID
ncbi:DUF305 domain-containing protein [Solicola gregarius]|uniref:DUF305 domain-containing protein n=1 Tax=Solicola gregarius TaxID=2908642 RepID=A0AA46YLJ6_9ACTN|nr:DUF305 domain-containing protein [Solicola gregarius]UYM05654.1 DUF305 domain-containing protein [Solicola gregarius]